jgi:glycosyltransferase involved in cell wall biosynthesis
MIKSQKTLLSNQLENALKLAAHGDTESATKALDQILKDKQASMTPQEVARVRRALELVKGKKKHTMAIAPPPRLAPNSKQASSGSNHQDRIAWPKISIVTPTYNQGQFIEDTILSVLNQHYPNLEYIIMDGGSTDNTPEIIEKYRDRIALAVSEPDKGQSNAINKGMRQASGDILYWLNSDDLLEPNTLLHVGAVYAEDGFDLLIGTCTCFDNDSQKLLNRHIATMPFGLRTDDITDIESTWLRGMYFHQPEVFFSKKIWDAAGGYVDEDLYYSMDYDLWARMAVVSSDAARIRASGKSFCLFRQHSKQKTSTVEAYLPELLSHSKSLRAKHLGGKSTGQFSGAKEFGAKLAIAAVSDYGFNGGAGIAHRRVCQVLQSAGHDVVQLSGFNQWQAETEDVSINSFLDALKILNPDVVILGNLHNLKHGLEIAEFSARHFPTIVIAHDFWWVTGRCAYTHGCHYLYTNCTRACPTPHEYPKLDPQHIHIEHLRKKSLLQSPNLYMLANSSYTYAAITQAFMSWGIRANPVGIVSLPITPEGEHHLVIPSDQTGDHNTAKRSQDEIRIILGCTDHGDYRKGADLAVLALRSVMRADERIHVDVYGRNCDLILDAIPEFSNRIFLHGYLSSKEQYLDLLARGDIFLGTSREETLGQTFVEAANAGLVTVGPSDTGYADVVNACKYSLGYQGSDFAAIADCLDQATELVSTTDSGLLRAIQEAHAKATFSGMAFLSSFNQYLYQSGLWKRLSYHGPTKIFELDYYSSEVSELTLASSTRHGGIPDYQLGKHAKEETINEVVLPIESIRLGPGLYLENVNGKAVLWLTQRCILMLPASGIRNTKLITINCHWIPEQLRGVGYTLAICGYGEIAGVVPSIDNGILEFAIKGTAMDHVDSSGMLLLSLSFAESIALPDGRTGLALVACGMSIHGSFE